MEKTTVIAITLLLYALIMIGMGFWVSARNQNIEDFFLGGRKLGPVVAAISYSASASSAWTLLGLSGAAYVMGLSVLWVAGGSCFGMLVAWFWVGPRLMDYSRQRNQLTVTDFLADDSSGRARRAIVLAASIIIIFSFTFYVAAQFQGAGNTFASNFDLSMPASIILGATIIMIYTLLGGFWAVSITDTVQGGLMCVAAVLLPLAALSEAGGWSGFTQALQAVSSPEQLSWTAGNAGLLALGIIFGGLGISLGTFGQPHLLVRFMALRDHQALRQARIITMVWYLLVFGGMVLTGLIGHVLYPAVANPESIFFTLSDGLFTPVLAGILLAAVLSAIMSTADSQLLVAASAIAHDLRLGKQLAARSLLISRLTTFGLVVFAVLVAVYLPESIFSRVLFAWSALGAAFGPTLFLRLAHVPLKPIGVFLSIVTGFGLAVFFYLLPNTTGDVLERVAPFFAALAVLLLFLQRR